MVWCSEHHDWKGTIIVPTLFKDSNISSIKNLLTTCHLNAKDIQSLYQNFILWPPISYFQNFNDSASIFTPHRSSVNFEYNVLVRWGSFETLSRRIFQKSFLLQPRLYSILAACMANPRPSNILGEPRITHLLMIVFRSKCSCFWYPVLIFTEHMRILHSVTFHKHTCFRALRHTNQ